MQLKWCIATLLFLSVVIHYIDRQCLSVLAQVIKKDLGLSPTDYANVLNAFLSAYTFMYLGSGFLVDRWGSKAALGVFMTWWSIANAFHALATKLWSLGAFRFLLGLGEPGNFMAGFRVISESFERQERLFVSGLMNAGASVGAVIAPPVVARLAIHWNWRGAFVICGSLGLLWVLPWMRVYRPLLAAPVLPVVPGEWKQYPKHPQSWGLFGTRFLSDPVWCFYLFWLPKYLVDQRGFSLQEMALVAWMPYLAADLGCDGRHGDAGEPADCQHFVFQSVHCADLPGDLCRHGLEDESANPYQSPLSDKVGGQCERHVCFWQRLGRHFVHRAYGDPAPVGVYIILQAGSPALA